MIDDYIRKEGSEPSSGAEQKAVSAEFQSSLASIAVNNHDNRWRKRHQLKTKLRANGWPPGVSIPKELLDQLEREQEQGSQDGKEVSP